MGSKSGGPQRKKRSFAELRKRIERTRRDVDSTEYEGSVTFADKFLALSKVARKGKIPSSKTINRFKNIGMVTIFTSRHSRPREFSAKAVVKKYGKEAMDHFPRNYWKSDLAQWEKQYVLLLRPGTIEKFADFLKKEMEAREAKKHYYQSEQLSSSPYELPYPETPRIVLNYLAHLIKERRTRK